MLPETDGLPAQRRLLAIMALSCGTALVVIDGGAPAVALPTIARDLAASPASTVLIVIVYQLVLIMTLLPFAQLGDRLGLRRLYQGGQMAFAIATALCFFAWSLPALLVVRTLQGLGAAAVLSVTPALVRAIYPTRQLGRGLGVNGVVVQSAAALAPTFGGFVLAWGRWPWVFASAVPFALLSLLLGRALPEPNPRNHPFDILGAALCALMFGLIVGGMQSISQLNQPLLSTAIIFAGVAVAILFVRRELRSPKPILPVDLLARPAMALAATGSLTAFVGAMLLLISLPFHLQQQYGFSPAQVGAMIAAWPAATMIAAPLSGTLADRYPAPILGGIGMTATGIGMLSFLWLPQVPHMADIWWRLALCGAGFGTFQAPNGRLIIRSAPRERAASAGALVSTTRLFGQTMGATLAAILLKAGLGGNTLLPLLSASLAAVALICSVARLAPALGRTGGPGMDASAAPHTTSEAGKDAGPVAPGIG